MSKGRLKYLFFTGMCAVALVFAAEIAFAGDVAATVKDEKGKPAQDAVVFLLPAKGNAPDAKKDATAIMDQVNKMFVPHVLAVQTGAKVKFPNSDNILHHVYSFSPAKKFELPLYKGKLSDPVIFDKPGVVVLGCNIHDWMLGYIVVVDTPYFAKTGKGGTAVLEGVPPGEYDAQVWHPDLKGASDSTKRGITVEKDKTANAAFSIKLKKRKSASSSDPMGMNQY